MTVDEYQELAWRTVNQELDAEIGLATAALGLTGEAGEVADLIKKHLEQGHPLNVAKVTKELGDVMWYVATLSKRLGISLPEILEENIAKLRARYPEGFSTERSVNREAGA